MRAALAHVKSFSRRAETLQTKVFSNGNGQASTNAEQPARRQDARSKGVPGNSESSGTRPR